jgi:hypothetical protein
MWMVGTKPDLKGNCVRAQGLLFTDAGNWPMSGSYELGNEPSCSTRDGQFLAQLIDC